MTDWLTTPAAALGRAIATQRLDPVPLTEAFLDAIATHAAGGAIYARLTPDRALAEAQAARARARDGALLGPLDGVPISWKDLFDSAGTATEAGTPLMAGRIPGTDAEALRRCTALGTVCLGKTHMSEIAFSGLGINPKAATPPNRQGADLAPGGSSSGAAASVALGLAPLAMGSDTGGSVRVPSAWNDLVGLKTTHGLVPLTGTVPLAASFDTIGPLARSTEDAALALAALGGPVADLDGATLEGEHLAVLDTIACEGLAPQVAAAFEGAVARLARAGARVTHVTAPDLPEAFDLAGALYTAEAWAAWRDLITATPGAMWYHISERVGAGADVLAADYLAAWQALRDLRARWVAQMAPYDAVICPTVAILPPAIAPLLADDDLYRDTNLMALRNTRIGNLMGLCGVSLPTGTPGVGLLLNGPAGADAALLRLAAAAERALG